MVAYSLSRMFGLINVTESDTHIKVTGIPADTMAKNISKIWKTSKINNYMFSELGANYFTFPKFFAIEILYMLNDMLSNIDRQITKATIKKIIALLLEDTWVKSTVEVAERNILDFKYLSRLSWKPKDHQVDFLKSFNTDVPKLNLNGYLLASPPGSGKTFMDLAVGVCLGEKAVVKIIISPKNALRLVWYTTITDPAKSAFKTPPSAWYSDEPGDAPVNVEWCVFHYEALEKAMTLGKKLSAAETPFMCIVDESHNFNEMTAQRTNDLIALCKLPTAHNHIWASGSPIKALGTEAIPLLSSIDPLFTDDVAQRFKKIFGGDAKRANEILNNRLNRVMFKIAKELIISDKPIVIQQRIKLKNSTRFTTQAVRAEMKAFYTERLKFYQKDMNNHKALFKHCLEIYRKSIKSQAEIAEFNTYQKYIDVISRNYDPMSMGDMVKYCRALEKNKIIPRLPSDLRKQFRNSQSVVKYVSLKIQGEALGQILGKRRAECADELAKNCKLEDIVETAAAKTLVFASFVSTVTEAVQYLESKGLAPKAVYADTNNMLNAIVTSFDKDPTVNPLCATYKSLSTAVPLIMANTVVLLDKPVRQYQYDQTISRCSRIGQTKQVYVYEILLDTGDEGNVSTRAEEIINWSRDQIEAILGDEFSGKDLEVVVESFVDNNNKAVKAAFAQKHTSGSFTYALECLKSLFR